ncbi:Mu transposase C-terminal domain-containing protein [Pseudoalteromonas sp. SR41-4]|uniref:Mu transposase C-terminal domain-containing protein n=1 Tax=Pseudoalteromonas sp. SR41-4 TaxID=2760950 RepID=UPI0015FF5766|nr:Mu transposase C-terminal domain-containing protein [Pseudoalteromonas sp. SR41-4]MBB1292986.1 transposase [Pseudoalteromonas sp. SR41-4]
MELLTAHQIAAFLLVSKRSIQLKAKAEAWPYTEVKGRGGKVRKYALVELPAHVCVQVQQAMIQDNQSPAAQSGKGYLAVNEQSDRLNQQLATELKHQNLKQLAGLENIPPKASAKIYLLNAAKEFVSANSLPKVLGFDLFSERYNQGLLDIPAEHKSLIPSVSRITLLRWQKTVDQKGIAGLAVKIKRSGKSIIDSDPELSDFCIAMIYQYPHVKATQVKEGLIARFYSQGKAIPAETTIREWLTRWKRDNSALYTKMANPDAWKNKYMSAMGKMDENIKRINQLWEFDSTPSDVMLVDGRHSLIGIIDVFTRRSKVVIHPTSDSTGICLVIRKAILDWGIPEIARTDNGKDYTSIQITSVFDALDIKHETTRPFSGEEKPYIERFFKTFSHDLAELLTGYIGHNVSERQAIEARKTFAQRLLAKQGGDKSAVDINMTAQQLQEFVDNWIDNRYHHKPHSNIGNKTPFELFAASRDQIKVIKDERLLDVMLQPVPTNRGLRTVGKEGIKLSGGFYIAPELGAIVGSEVLCKWDPKNVGRIYVFNRMNNEFICVAVDHEIQSAGMTRQDVAHHAKRSQAAETSRQLKELKKTAKSVNVSDIANEVLSHYSEQNKALATLPKQSVEHTNVITQSAIKALDSKPVTTYSDEQLSEFERRRKQLSDETAAANINPVPLFNNPQDKAMYHKKQRLNNQLSDVDALWLNTWELQNRALSARLDDLLTEMNAAPAALTQLQKQ